MICEDKCGLPSPLFGVTTKHWHWQTCYVTMICPKTTSAVNRKRASPQPICYLPDKTCYIQPRVYPFTGMTMWWCTPQTNINPQSIGRSSSLHPISPHQPRLYYRPRGCLNAAPYADSTASSLILFPLLLPARLEVLEGHLHLCQWRNGVYGAASAAPLREAL